MVVRNVLNVVVVRIVVVVGNVLCVVVVENV